MARDRYLHVWPSAGSLTEAYVSDEQIRAEGWWCRACRTSKPETKEINIRIDSKKAGEHTGLPLSDWVSARARNEAIVRGSSLADTRICDVCGHRHYFAMPPHYIYPPIPSEFAISQSPLSGLVFSTDYADRLNGMKMKGVTVEELPVFNAPLDGLGEFSD